MDKIICYYHSEDLDGHCSAAILYYYFTEIENIKKENIQLIGRTHKQEEIDTSKINKNCIVYYVDYVELSTLKDMVEKAKDVIIIDHHESVHKDLHTDMSEILKKINYFYSTDFSACELVWKYFFTDKMPKFVYLLGRYDIFKHNEDTIPFQYGMKSIIDKDIGTDSGKEFWNHLFSMKESKLMDEFISKTIQIGTMINSYLKNMYEIMCKDYAFELEFEGKKFIAMNTSINGSLQFDSIWLNGGKETHDGMLIFCRTKEGRWTFSLYTTNKDIDLSVIAKKYGGGGHPGACGFSLDYIPWLKH